MGATQHQLRLVRSADNVGAQCQFNEYALADENFDGARIYLSQADSLDLLPLIVWVSGNGPPCSAFALRDGEVQQGSTSLHSFLQEFADEKARVMVVDRQHVAFGQVWNPIDGTQAASHEFLENHTLGAWSGLIMAAIRAAWNMPTIDASRTLVVGHSDGAFVAAHIAASLPDVSHVACLAPSGLSLLWDFQYKARTLGPDVASADQICQSIVEEAQSIAHGPERIDRFWLGYPWKYWASGYLQQSTLEKLTCTSAKIYLVHGTADEANSMTGFDVMCAALEAVGKDLVIERIVDGDHSFLPPGEPRSAEGFRPVFENVVHWFFE